MELGAAGLSNHTPSWAGLLELFAAGSVWMTCCCLLHDGKEWREGCFGVTIAARNSNSNCRFSRRVRVWLDCVELSGAAANGISWWIDSRQW